MNALCDDIIEGNYRSSKEKELSLIKDSSFINLDSNSDGFFHYSYDANLSKIKYIISKNSASFNNSMSILSFLQIMFEITEEYKAKTKHLEK